MGRFMTMAQAGLTALTTHWPFITTLISVQRRQLYLVLKTILFVINYVG